MNAVRSGRYRYSRGIMGLPSLFVVLAWPAIWLVWITIGRTPRIDRVPAATRTVFSEPRSAELAAMDPRDIIRLQRAGDEMDEPSSAVISHYVVEPSYLGRGPLRAERSGDAPYEESFRDAPAATGYRPVWREEPVFKEPVTGEPRLIVECSGKLKQYGFNLPELVSRMLAIGKTPWQVVVHMDTDENGHVEHVFLDHGSDDPLIDQKVLKAMYRGRLVTKGTRCSGTVTVSFAGE